MCYCLRGGCGLCSVSGNVTNKCVTVCVVDSVDVLFQVMSQTNVFTVCVVDAVDVLFQVMSQTNVLTVCVVNAVDVLFQVMSQTNVLLSAWWMRFMFCFR